MRFTYKLILSICLSALLSSCIEDYDIDFPLLDKYLTMNAELNPEDSIKALITLPKRPYGIGHFETPKDAIVNLFKDDTLLEQLSFKSIDGEHGIFISSIVPEAGITYRIEASYANFPKASANQTTLDIVDIEYWQILGVGDTLSDNISIEVHVAKNEIDKRYFYVKNELEVSINYIDTMGAVTDSIMHLVLPVLSELGYSDIVGHTAFETNSNPTIFYDLSLKEIQRLLADMDVQHIHLNIEFSELSQDGFLYRKAFANHEYDNYGEPNRVYSNIENGMGIMMSISKKHKKVVLK